MSLKRDMLYEDLNYNVHEEKTRTAVGLPPSYDSIKSLPPILPPTQLSNASSSTSPDKHEVKVLPRSDVFANSRTQSKVSFSTKPEHKVEVLPQPDILAAPLPQRLIRNDMSSYYDSNSGSNLNEHTYSNVKIEVSLNQKREYNSLSQRNTHYERPKEPVFNSKPVSIRCLKCRYEGKSRVRYEANWRTHTCAAILCLVGWCCCICCVPYCTKDNQTAKHYCTQCGAYRGIYVPESFH